MDTPAYVVNVDVAVHRGDEYLFIERAADEPHAAGLLGFPGGTLEADSDDEVLEATGAREVREETGVTVSDVTYVDSFTFEADDGTRCLNVLTRAPYEEGRARPRSPDEVAAVHWLTPEELRTREDVPEFTEHYVDLVEADRTDG